MEKLNPAKIPEGTRLTKNREKKRKNDKPRAEDPRMRAHKNREKSDRKILANPKGQGTSKKGLLTTKQRVTNTRKKEGRRKPKDE